MEQYIQKMLQSMPKSCTNLNIIGDRYDFDPTESIIRDKRECRELETRTRQGIRNEDSLDIPDWNELMSNTKIIGTLFSYFLNCLCQNTETLIPENTIVILGGSFETRSKCVAVRNAEVVEIQQLSCTQHKEAPHGYWLILARILCWYSWVQESSYCLHGHLALYHFCFLPLRQLWIQKNDSILIDTWTSSDAFWKMWKASKTSGCLFIVC